MSNKGMTSLAVVLLTLILADGCARRQNDTGEPYAWAKGLKEGEVHMLAAGRLSGGSFEMNAAVSEDGSEIWFTRAGGDGFGEGMVIMHSRWTGEEWAVPDTAVFSGEFVDADPFLTRDRKRLYFASKRPRNGAIKGDFDLWYVDRRGDGWSDPVRLPEPVNSSEHDVSPWITDDGTLWFSSRRDGGQGDYDIWYAPATESGFSEPVNAGPGINTLGVEVDVCLADNGSLLIFASQDQPIHFGSGDLYAMMRGDDGWVGPYNLGQPVNSSGMECCPSITPDNRFLIFSSTRTMARTIPPAGAEGFEDMPVPDTPGNGLGDLYITDLSVLPVILELGWSPERSSQP